MTLDERDMRGYRRLELSYRPVRSTGPVFQHPLFIAADESLVAITINRGRSAKQTPTQSPKLRRF